MKKEVVGGNVVQGSDFKYYFKMGKRIEDTTRAAVTVSMKGMLGNTSAITQRVAAS